MIIAEVGCIQRWTIPANIGIQAYYLLKVDNRNTRTKCEIRQQRSSGIFIVNFKYISHLAIAVWVTNQLTRCTYLPREILGEQQKKYFLPFLRHLKKWKKIIWPNQGWERECFLTAVSFFRKKLHLRFLNVPLISDTGPFFFLKGQGSKKLCSILILLEVGLFRKSENESVSI